MTARERRTRTTSRVLVLATDEQGTERVLLFADSDPGVPDARFWITPGGGVDPGETLREAAIRELIEETGLRVADADLRGPVASRQVIHGFSNKLLDQREEFFVVRSAVFEPDTSGHTLDEQETLSGYLWWSRAELAAAQPWVWPATLPDIWDRAITWQPGDAVLTLPDSEESTVPADVVRLTAFITGRVQGVGFRWFTRSNALQLGLVGSATNKSDGRVEVVAEGPRESCELLLRRLRGPNPPGDVDFVSETWDTPRGGLTGFEEK